MICYLLKILTALLHHAVLLAETVLQKMISCFLIAIVMFSQLCGLLISSCSSDYDPYTADTQSARDAIMGWCQLEDISEVREAYYAQEGAIKDPVYYIAFYAPPHIAGKIVANVELKSGRPEGGDVTGSLNLPWWDNYRKAISESYYKHDKKNRGIWQLWYEPESQYIQYIIWYY